MEASLTCAVCLGVFREPVTLPLCSHNFCKSCVADCAEPQSRLYPHSTSVSVACPLCRKISDIHGGLSALPTNTTLAELARMLAPGKGESPPSGTESSLTGHCPDHPEHRLELFCKNCARVCCGKCVSTAHQGIFHSVNLLDMVYQEEKLMFFDSLKKLREMYEKVRSEGLDDASDIKDTLQKKIDLVNSAFDEAQKALDLKKLHLLDFIKQQESSAIKQQEKWKKAMAHRKITLEHLLKDSEALVDEVEPTCFLKMSCSLNKRMKSHLDLMELTASHCDTPKPECNRVDLKPIMDAISDLKITDTTFNDPFSKGNGDVSFKTLTRTWENQPTTTQKYSPVQIEELCYLQGQLQKLTIRFLSITEMPEYRHLSFEEHRKKYYEDSIIQDGVSLTKPQWLAAGTTKDNPFLRTVDPTKMKSAKIKKQAGLGGCFTFKPNCKPEPSPKSTSKMEPGKLPQDGQFSNVIFPNVVTIQKPLSGFLREATGGVSSDVKGDETIKETNHTSVPPAFCLGRSDSTPASKPCKNERTWKKPKTTTLPATSVIFQSSLANTSKPVFTFSNAGHSNETKVTSLFCNPFSHQEPKAQENKVPTDLVTEANCSEEFYDAISNAHADAEETGETRTPSNEG